MWWVLAGSLTILSVKKKWASILLLVALVWSVAEHIVEGRALLFIGLVVIIGIINGEMVTRLRASGQRRWRLYTLSCEALLVVAGVALFVHLVPGFNNPKILDGVKAGPLSAPFSMYFNFDKALLPFILLAACPTLFFCHNKVRQNKAVRPRLRYWILLALGIPILLLIAVLLGGLRIEPHLPEWLGSFMLANLFFVSLAEEALFRGYLQQRIAGWWGNLPALFITALIFGLAHVAGGPLLMVFAGLAGLIYGLAWMWSGRLWVSTLFHFGLNLCQLLFFTYPFYQPHS